MACMDWITWTLMCKSFFRFRCEDMLICTTWLIARSYLDLCFSLFKFVVLLIIGCLCRALCCYVLTTTFFLFAFTGCCSSLCNNLWNLQKHELIIFNSVDLCKLNIPEGGSPFHVGDPKLRIRYFCQLQLLAGSLVQLRTLPHDRRCYA